ncbi:GNAT family N-acetyltransferase, partial [Paenibacillus sp. IB182496]
PFSADGTWTAGSWESRTSPSNHAQPLEISVSRGCAFACFGHIFEAHPCLWHNDCIQNEGGAQVEIRNARAEEWELFLALGQYAFQYELSEADQEDWKRRFESLHVWGAFEGESLQAMLIVIPLHMYLQGQSVEMGGVASVATWPEQRRNGAVKRLIQQALQHMRSEGQAWSMLAPFSYGFYRKYGWEMLTEHRTYTLAKTQLPQPQDVGGRVERRPVLNGALAKELSPLYEAYASRYNGTLQRTLEWWETSVFKRKSGQAAIYYNEANEPRGYVVYACKNRNLHVHELVALDEQARRGIWRFLSNHDSMINHLYWSAPMDDRLPAQLPDPRIGQSIEPYFMVRIVDVMGALSDYPFETVSGASSVRCIRLTIEDATCAWNQGVFELTPEAAGSVRVSRASADETDGLNGVSLACDIQTLSVMMSGYLRPFELYRMLRLQGDEEAVRMLEQLIPARPTGMLDFF